MRLSGLLYYLRSLPTLLRGVKNLGSVAAMALSASHPTRRIQLADGSSFLVNTLLDVWVLKETCLDRQYETFGETIQDGWTVVDIGGGWGDFAVSIGRRNPKCRVIAFEPFPPSIELFEKNTSLNQVENVQLVAKAVGQQSGRMHLSTQNTEAVQLSTAQMDGGQGLMVEGITLGDAFETLQIEVCDFLKMDCEGGEYEILFSAPEDVIQRIKRICLETHDGVTQYSHFDLIEYLHKHGFQTRFETNPVHSNLGMLYGYRLSGAAN